MEAPGIEIHAGNWSCLASRTLTLNRIRPYFKSEELQHRIHEMAQVVAADYSDGNLCLISVLNGALMFTADLVRCLQLPLQLDFIRASSYCGTSTNGNPQSSHGPSLNLTGKDILVVDDILDTGLTLAHICEELKEHEPNSVRTCVLLNKQERRRNGFQADYVGFEIEDLFVVGYGMDYDERFRNLPYVGIFEPQTKD
jgi:hypoxanthine phosphoribosyltransferase